ncbi:hypothetical protein AAGS61_18310 [Lysinibacillus sp. KU-BSD001]|uniref:hypothetical protein n=1 Tax=Lysinibacillus sp. KU-BSD001 TaxID=3141328 RepID=UPI0036E09823
MLKGKKEIQIIEYVPDSVKKAGVRLTEAGDVQSVLFSAQKLIVALARTIISMNPKDGELVYQAISSYSALYPLISDDQEFRFKADVDFKIRDYILSTRTGELAPAIGYLFAQEQLNKPFVVDFASLLTDESAKGAAPDLIVSSPTGEWSFIESKGSKDMRNKGKLRDALCQSENAATLMDYTAQDFYGVFVSIPKADADYPAAIHYTCTLHEGERSVNDNRPLIYKHYASWFMLLGFQEIAERLANGEPMMMKKPKKKTAIKKQAYYVLDTKDSLFFKTIQGWDKQFKRAQFGIAEEVFAFLNGQEEAQLILPPLQQVQKQGNKYDLFADGTAIFYK